MTIAVAGGHVMKRAILIGLLLASSGISALMAFLFLT